jgi:hypothetical protein
MVSIFSSIFGALHLPAKKQKSEEEAVCSKRSSLLRKKIKAKMIYKMVLRFSNIFEALHPPVNKQHSEEETV